MILTESVRTSYVVLVLISTCLQLFTITTGLLIRDSDDLKEYCLSEAFNASCGRGSVILMQRASYGRMKIGRCATKNYGFMGCYIDVLPYIDTVCSGRHHCNFIVPGENMPAHKPCPIDFASYLAASYTCVPVERSKTCSRNGGVLLAATSHPGYLASITARDGVQGSPHCPWTIRAEPGQKLNITLLDFGLSTKKVDNEVQETHIKDGVYCQKYAVIKEPGADRVICSSGRERERVVYISMSNVIQVNVAQHIASKSSKANFLLKYQVIGCPDLQAPPGGWMERLGDNVAQGCNQTREKWYLRCDGQRWYGEKRNCSSNSPKTDASENMWNAFGEDWSSPFGILVVSGLGVALGLLIGMLMLGLVLLLVKRRRAKCLARSLSYDETAQDSDDNNTDYVVQNKQNYTAAGLVDQMELVNLTESNTYGAMWRSRPPSYMTPGEQSGNTHSPRHGPPQVAAPTPRTEQLAVLRVNAPRVNDNHIYESPKFLRREISDSEVIQDDRS